MDENTTDVEELINSSDIIIFDTNVFVRMREVGMGLQEHFVNRLKLYDSNHKLFFPVQVIEEFKHISKKESFQKRLDHKVDEIIKLGEELQKVKSLFENFQKVPAAKYMSDFVDDVATLENDEKINEVLAELLTHQKNMKNKYMKSGSGKEGEGYQKILKSYEDENEIDNFLLDPKRNSLHAWENEIERYALIQEGFSRVSHNIPPAYVDSYNKITPFSRAKPIVSMRSKSIDEMTQYLGDFFIWKSILKRAIDSSQSFKVVFVTADVKNDWFTTSSNGNKVINLQLEKEFNATCKLNGLSNYSIDFVKFEDWSMGLEDDEEDYEVLSELHILNCAIAFERNFDSLIKKIKKRDFDDIMSQLSDYASSEIYDDSTYSDGFFTNAVGVDFDADDMVIDLADEVEPGDGIIEFSADFYISGDITVTPMYNEDDPDTELPEIRYPVNWSGTLNFSVIIDDAEEEMKNDYKRQKSEWIDKLLEMQVDISLGNQNVEIITGSRYD